MVTEHITIVKSITKVFTLHGSRISNKEQGGKCSPIKVLDNKIIDFQVVSYTFVCLLLGIPLVTARHFHFKLEITSRRNYRENRYTATFYSGDPHGKRIKCTLSQYHYSPKSHRKRVEEVILWAELAISFQKFLCNNILLAYLSMGSSVYRCYPTKKCIIYQALRRAEESPTISCNQVSTISVIFIGPYEIHSNNTD